MSVDTVIRTLYHYTNSSGLVGIVRNRELWFSDIRFLNDSREFKHSCDILFNNLEHHIDVHRSSWIDSGYSSKEFDGMVKNLVKNCNYNYIMEEFTMYGIPFVFSMTERRDSLGQWRAYGNGEYCVGFNADKLAKNGVFLPIKVKYTNLENKYVDEDIAHACARFSELHRRRTHSSSPMDMEIFYHGLKDIISHLVKVGFFVKHKDPGFADEAEWRLVIVTVPGDSNLFFDSGGRYPKPRLRIGLPLESYSFGALEEIICGPGIDYQMFSASVIMFSKQMHILSYPTLHHSKVPYRTDS